jgi:hypothetical protein
MIGFPVNYFPVVMSVGDISAILMNVMHGAADQSGSGRRSCASHGQLHCLTALLLSSLKIPVAA